MNALLPTGWTNLRTSLAYRKLRGERLDWLDGVLLIVLNRIVDLSTPSPPPLPSSVAQAMKELRRLLGHDDLENALNNACEDRLRQRISVLEKREHLTARSGPQSPAGASGEPACPSTPPTATERSPARLHRTPPGPVRQGHRGGGRAVRARSVRPAQPALARVAARPEGGQVDQGVPGRGAVLCERDGLLAAAKGMITLLCEAQDDPEVNSLHRIEPEEAALRAAIAACALREP